MSIGGTIGKVEELANTLQVCNDKVNKENVDMEITGLEDFYKRRDDDREKYRKK